MSETLLKPTSEAFNTTHAVEMELEEVLHRADYLEHLIQENKLNRYMARLATVSLVRLQFEADQKIMESHL